MPKSLFAFYNLHKYFYLESKTKAHHEHTKDSSILTMNAAIRETLFSATFSGMRGVAVTLYPPCENVTAFETISIDVHAATNNSFESIAIDTVHSATHSIGKSCILAQSIDRLFLTPFLLVACVTVGLAFWIYTAYTLSLFYSSTTLPMSKWNAHDWGIPKRSPMINDDVEPELKPESDAMPKLRRSARLMARKLRKEQVKEESANTYC